MTQPQTKLLQLIHSLKLPFTDKGAIEYVEKLSGEEVEFFVVLLSKRKEFLDQIDAAARLANPDEYEKITKEYEDQIEKIEDDYAEKLAAIEDEADRETEKISDFLI